MVKLWTFTLTPGKEVGNVRCILPLVILYTNGLIEFSLPHSHFPTTEALSIENFKASLVSDIAFKCLLTETKVTGQLLGGTVVLSSVYL